jgi:hypothetical protein
MSARNLDEVLARSTELTIENLLKLFEREDMRRQIAADYLRRVVEDPKHRLAFTIKEFCAAHRLSMAQYYVLKSEGEGPDEMAVARRRYISFESAARWREKCEQVARQGIVRRQGTAAEVTTAT